VDGFNRALNALAGGATTVEGCPGGVRLSGFEVTDYTPTSASAATDGSITFNRGAFMHSGNTTGLSYLGLIGEETAPITLSLGDVENWQDTSKGLSLWGWVVDGSVAGVDMNAYFKVTETDSPPIAHAVELARTEDADLTGAYHWRPIGGASLCEINTRLQNIVSAGGSTRDFYHIAQNYHDAHAGYTHMTFQDFGSVDGKHGAWVPVAGDFNKFDTDNRELKRGTAQTQSQPFPASAFLIPGGGGTYYKLDAVRVVWLEQNYVADVPQPDPVYDSTIELLDGAAVLVSITGEAEYDTDQELDGGQLQLSAASDLSVKIIPATPADQKFMRCILLMRTTE